MDAKTGEIVKVVYQHYGYSEISALEMDLKARRDRSCDGSYGQYVSESPAIRIETRSSSLSLVGSIPGVTMVDGFKGLPPESRLKCYRLAPGGVRSVGLGILIIADQ